MKKNKNYLFYFVFNLMFSILFSLQVFAQTPNQTNTPQKIATKNLTANATTAKNTSSENFKTADNIGIVGVLEEMLVKRYTQGLASVIDKESFNLSVQLDVGDVNPDFLKAGEEPPLDLLVGNLDSEALLNKYGLENDRNAIMSFLSTKKVNSVLFTVGLQQELGEDAKKETEEWIAQRAKAEFGAIAKTEIKFIKVPSSKNFEMPKNWVDWLSRFQQLAGIAILALSLLLGILVWRSTTSRAELATSQTGEGGLSVNMKSDSHSQSEEGGKFGVGSAGQSTETEFDIQNKKSTEEIFVISQKINSLLPKINHEIENLTRIWCAAGEEGKLKLVWFADSVGKELGRLPIPHESVNEIAKVFASMSQKSLQDKKNILEKVYWDLITTINLGSSSLEQPFSYLTGADTTVVSEILLTQNAKLKTLISMYLPDDVRTKFIAPLTAEQKIELLTSASQLKEISNDELAQVNSAVKGQITSNEPTGSVKLDHTLDKMIQSLNIIEEINLLPQVNNKEMSQFKLRVPSLAFISEWKDESLSLLISKLKSDQVVTYLRLKPDMLDRILNLAPPMLAEVVKDDYDQPDKLSENEKIQNLLAMNQTLKNLTNDKSIILENVFVEKNEGDNVINFRSA